MISEILFLAHIFGVPVMNFFTYFIMLLAAASCLVWLRMELSYIKMKRNDVKLLKEETLQTAKMLRETTLETAKILKETTAEMANSLEKINLARFIEIALILEKIETRIIEKELYDKSS